MISLGIHLRHLARLRVAVAVSVVLAAAVAIISAYRVSVFPPRLAPRGNHVAGAHTQILVDSTPPGVLANAYSSDDFMYLHAGALLLAGIMVNDSLQVQIADRARLPIGEVHFSAPQAPSGAVVQQPAVRAGAPYGLAVAARPTVPILDVYAEAPTEAEAMRLVDSAFNGLHDYLLGAGAAGTFHLRVTQLGRGSEVKTPGGPSLLHTLAVFAAAFVACCEAALLIYRVGTQLRTPRRSLEAA
jgi:hypothetical protein